MKAQMAQVGLAAAGAVSLMAPVYAGGTEILIDDHFDDGVLDPAWEIVLECVDDWTWEESGTELIVTDIETPCWYDDSNGEYANVILHQPVPSLGDLYARIDCSWDSEESIKAMQVIDLLLSNGCGEVVLSASYHDGWVDHRGAVEASIEGTYWYSGLSSLPFAGSASLTVERTGCDVTISWDGEPVLAGSTASPIEQISVVFRFYGYTGHGGPSLFGTERVDLVHVEGTTVEPPDGDVNCDRFVDLEDILVVLASWGECPEPPAPCLADANDDGRVDFEDILRVLADWGQGLSCSG